MNEFTEIRLLPRNLEKKHIRSWVFNAIQEFSPQIRGIVLDVGCGQKPYHNWILKNCPNVSHYFGTDISASVTLHKTAHPDIRWDARNLPICDNCIDTILLTEVLEHTFDPQHLLTELFRVLKPGGKIIITTPFVWPLHEVPYDVARYTPFALNKLVASSGFSDIQVTPSGGWDACLAQMIGLWVNRKKRNRKITAILRWATLPLIYYLLKLDTPPVTFHESSMSPCYKVTAAKP